MIKKNPFKGEGIKDLSHQLETAVSLDVQRAQDLYRKCPQGAVTPVIELKSLAERLGLECIHLKDERQRMGLGSFKALGAAYAIAKHAEKKLYSSADDDFTKSLQGVTFACASAGNHGLSLAAGAHVFGAQAVVYLPETVPTEFESRLQGRGAKVIRSGAVYEDSMRNVIQDSEKNGWILLSDSSWNGYEKPARDVMEGYLTIGCEVQEQIGTPPTHVFVQAGVGGLAAACAAAVRVFWGQGPKVCVVEPEYAPALFRSIEAGKAVSTDGPVSNMGRLDCKEPSLLALEYLAREADGFMCISDQQAQMAVDDLHSLKIETTPSGAAGLAGLMVALGEGGREILELDKGARVLVILSEGRTDG